MDDHKNTSTHCCSLMQKAIPASRHKDGQDVKRIALPLPFYSCPTAQPFAALQARFTDAVEMSKCSAVALMLALFSLRH